jgi:PTS system ascorbate-specific IIA component
LANALRDCALHVFPECSSEVLAVDVPPQEAPEDTLSAVLLRLDSDPGRDTLVLTDVMGATPANIAQRLVNGPNTRLVAGVNLPMLLRTVCYRHESLDQLIERALDGGKKGVCRLEGNPVNT